MRSGTKKLRATVQGGAILAGAAAATAFGWSAWVDTASVTGATVAQAPAPPVPGALTDRPAATTRQAAAVLVCQATGDGSYVLIRVLPDRLAEYRRNPNNIVPAPPGGCPAGVGAGAEPTPTTPPTASTPPPTTSAPRPTPPPRTTSTPRPTTPPRTTSTPRPATPPRTTSTPRPTTPPPVTTTPRSTPAPAPAGAVAGASASSAEPRRSAYTGELPADLERLPNTGNETALLLFFGVDLLLLGAGLRLRSRRHGF